MALNGPNRFAVDVINVRRKVGGNLNQWVELISPRHGRCPLLLGGKGNIGLSMVPRFTKSNAAPERNDMLTLLDGALLIGYIFTTAIAVGTTVTAGLATAARCLGPWRCARFHHLAQTLIPLAAAGVFLGLSTLTVNQLSVDGIRIPFVGELRALILLLATSWTTVLFWRWQAGRRHAGRKAAIIAESVSMRPAPIRSRQ
jgi:hypothetical protein